MDETRVVLVGGPASLCEADRIQHLTEPTEKIKIRHGNGHEHFAATGQRVAHDEVESLVFAWCAQTKIEE